MCDPLALCWQRYRVVSRTLVGSSRGTIRPPLLLAHASERLADIRLVTGGIAEQRVENRSHVAFGWGVFCLCARWHRRRCEFSLTRPGEAAGAIRDRA